MHDLNKELLASGIGLVAAQHLEGGPEAQLYLNAGGVQLEMFGSFETSFKENDTNSIPGGSQYSRRPPTFFHASLAAVPVCPLAPIC